MAGGRPQDQRQSQARDRRRSAELFVTSVRSSKTSSFRGRALARTRNLEIPQCAIAHLRSGPSDHPGMTNERSYKKACRLYDDRPFLSVKQVPQALLYATHTELDGTGRAFKRPKRSGDDLGNHPADASAGQADHAGSTGGQVKHTATDERAAVVDGDDDTASAMGHPELGAERQAAVGRGHGAGVHALARGGPAAGFVAVIGGHAREATSGRRGDRGIGVKPGTADGPADSRAGRVAGVVMMMVVVMAVVMAVRFGRGFGDAATEQESCGDNS